LGPHVAQVGPKMPQVGPKVPQDGPKIAPRSPKMAPKAQDEHTMPQNCPKKALTRLLGTSKIVLSPRRRAIFGEFACFCSSLFFPRLSCPFEAKIGFKMASGWPGAAPRWPPGSPRWSQDGSKRVQTDPKLAQELSKKARADPKMTLDGKQITENCSRWP